MHRSVDHFIRLIWQYITFGVPSSVFIVECGLVFGPHPTHSLADQLQSTYVQDTEYKTHVTLVNVAHALFLLWTKAKRGRATKILTVLFTFQFVLLYCIFIYSIDATNTFLFAAGFGVVVVVVVFLVVVVVVYSALGWCKYDQFESLATCQTHYRCGVYALRILLHFYFSMHFNLVVEKLQQQQNRDYFVFFLFAQLNDLICETQFFAR